MPAGGLPSIANEIVRPGGPALRGPAPSPPILDKAEITHDSLEARCLAHGVIGGVPEPGGRNRLEVIASHLVLIEFQHTLRCPHVPIGEAHIADAWQTLRRG